MRVNYILFFRRFGEWLPMGYVSTHCFKKITIIVFNNIIKNTTPILSRNDKTTINKSYYALMIVWHPITTFNPTHETSPKLLTTSPGKSFSFKIMLTPIKSRLQPMQYIKPNLIKLFFCIWFQILRNFDLRLLSIFAFGLVGSELFHSSLVP